MSLQTFFFYHTLSLQQSFINHLPFAFQNIVTMVAFSSLLLGLGAIAGTFAAPAPEPLPEHVEQRGPSNFILTDDHPLMIARRNASLEARSTPSYVQK